MGEVEWSPTQARVFGQLLDKCVPDLSASFMVSEKDDGDLASCRAASLRRWQAVKESGARLG